ncbi:MAG: glucose-6-phosphate dehydrogenase [Proteobacteria bacterium]|nr:glucose-6-phosphate dehydrogenase [Pseudomonadota bacterium]
MTTSTNEASLFVIFGGTGDLSRRKLLPALGNLDTEGHLNPRMRVLAVGRRPKTDEEFRQLAKDALGQAGLPSERIEATARRLHYQVLDPGKPEDYRTLGRRLYDLGREHDIPANYAFYLSLPPRAFPLAVAGLGEAGLNQPEGWSRLVVEKPFGKDLASAEKLNALVHQHFQEDQIYRIDHYLGKETVQNLLVFRLANAFIESSWNRERIDAVQITVGENLGVGTRAEYYDHSGALRDMVQNHLTQLLTLVAMEVPSSFSARAIRHEKIKVLQSIAPIEPANVVRGQYTAGELNGQAVRGYLQEDGVAKGSQTETFVAIKLFVDSWRWQGVPFYLRTGKCLPAKTTQIAVRFREAPVGYFKQMGCNQDTADVLTIALQPDEGFIFHLDIKMPGAPLRLERIPLRFNYNEHFEGSLPDGYQTLLLDVLNGDQTLFVHSDEVEGSWRVYAPLLDNPPKIYNYAAGTWGPPEADSLAIPERDLWQKETV